jgi:acetylglutamate kinase
MEQGIQRARILIEALPYIRDFRGRRIVIKYGGHAMTDAELKRVFARQIVLLQYVGIQVTVVHGGGPQINEALKRLGVKSSFVEGNRVTDEETLKVVEMVLSGSINKEIVNLINTEGGRAVGISGKDGGLIKAHKLVMKDGPDGKPVDLGLVGEVSAIDTHIVDTVEAGGFVAVIAPLGVDRDGCTFNINADTAAAAIASSLKAEKLILLTDESGVLDKDGNLISSINYEEITGMVKNGVVTGGMIPKIECCRYAIASGVRKAHIIDGRVPYSILLEMLTDSGIGTQITKG